MRGCGQSTLTTCLAYVSVAHSRNNCAGVTDTFCWQSPDFALAASLRVSRMTVCRNQQPTCGQTPSAGDLAGAINAVDAWLCTLEVMAGCESLVKRGLRDVASTTRQRLSVKLARRSHLIDIDADSVVVVVGVVAVTAVVGMWLRVCIHGVLLLNHRWCRRCYW